MSRSIVGHATSPPSRYLNQQCLEQPFLILGHLPGLPQGERSSPVCLRWSCTPDKLRTGRGEGRTSTIKNQTHCKEMNLLNLRLLEPPPTYVFEWADFSRNDQRCANAHTVQVAIVQSATQAWQQVFFGMQFKPGDRILTSVAEYGSNYINFLQVVPPRMETNRHSLVATWITTAAVSMCLSQAGSHLCDSKDC